MYIQNKVNFHFSRHQNNISMNRKIKIDNEINDTKMLDGNKKVKLVIFMNINVSNGRGVPRFVLNMVKYFPKEKFDITLIQSDWSDSSRLEPKEYEPILNNIRVIEYNDIVNKFNFLMKSKILKSLLLALIKPFLMKLNRHTLPKEAKLTIKSADIVYLTSNYYSLMIKKKNGVMGSCHTFYVRNGKLGKIYGRLTKLRWLNRFPLMHTFPGYELYFDKQNTRMCSLPLPIEWRQFLPTSNNRTGKIKLLFVAGLDKSKGLDVILDSYQLLDKNKFELHIVGRGGMENEIIGREVEGIYYYGALSQEELSKKYASADIFVYPTKSDTYSTVILEALSCGLIVIASDMLKGIFDVYAKQGYLRYCKNDSKSFASTIISSEDMILGPESRFELHDMVGVSHDPRLIFESLSDFMISYSQYQ